MRWLKIPLYAVSVLLLLAVVSTALVFMIYDDDDFRDYLITTVENNSDARLTVKGDFSVKLSFNPTFSVTDLAVHSVHNQYDVGIGQLTVRISLFSLLSGPARIQELRLNDVTATVISVDHKPPGSGDQDLNEKKPVQLTNDSGDLLPELDRVSINNLTIRHEGREARSDHYIQFDKLDLARNEVSRFLMLRGTGVTGEQAYKLSGKLGALRDIGISGSPYPVELQITSKAYNLNLKGTIDQPLQGQGIDLAIQGQLAELSDFIAYKSDKAVSLGQVNGSLRMKGDLPNLILENVRLSLKRDDVIKLELVNNLINPRTWGETGLQVKGFINDSKVYSWLLPEKLPTFQRSDLSATLFRKGQNYTIEKINIQASSTDVVQVGLEGLIGLGDSADIWPIPLMDMQVRFSSSKTETIKPFLLAAMPEIGQTSGKLRLLMESGSLSVQELAVEAGSESTLFVNAKGQINNISIADKTSSQTLDLQLTARASSTGKLEPMYKLPLPEVQDVRFEGHLTGQPKNLLLDKIKLNAGKSDKVKISAQGAIQFGDRTDATDKNAVGLNVQLDASASQSLSDWVGRQVPAMGPVKAEMRVSGTLDQVLIEAEKVRIGSKKGLNLVARGKMGDINLKQGAKLQATDLQLQLDAPSLESLPGVSTYTLPAFGKVSGSAQLLSKGDSYKIDKISMISGDKSRPTLRINGSILDLASFFGVALQFNVDADMHDLLVAYYKSDLKELGRVTGILKLSDANGPLGIHDMSIVAEKKQAYRVKVSGDIGNILERDERDADIELSVQDWDFIEKLLNKPLPDFAATRAEGKLFSKKNVSRFDGELKMGNTAITTRLSIDYAGKLPRLTGSVVAPVVNLSDVGVTPESVNTVKERAADKNDTKKRLLTTEPIPLKTLTQMNGEIQVKIDELKGTDLSYHSLEMKLALNDGKFRLFPARFSFEKGVFETDFSINASQKPASYKLNIVADDVDLEAIALQFQQPPVAVKGEMNVIIDLTAKGGSTQAIASSLDGKIGLVGENFYLLRAYVELLMRDILSWTFSGIGLREQYVIVNCGIIRLTANQGQVDSDLIVMDGRNINLMSDLSLNLRDETIDMVINPNKKSRIFSSVSPVHIKGPMRDPNVEALSASEVATGYGGLVFVPQVFIPIKALGFLGGVVTKDDDAGQSPCQDVGKANDKVNDKAGSTRPVEDSNDL